jgi:mono/diheme cytochrome c family protein
LGIAWLLHAAVLAHGLIGSEPRFGFAPALSVTAWLVLTVYAIESRMYPQLKVRRALAWLGAAAVLLAILFPGTPLHVTASPWLPLHLALGIASYGLFGAAVVHAWLTTRAEKHIRLATGPQAEVKPPQFTQPQIDALAEYVASRGPGPAIPKESLLQGDGDAAIGAELFRINCAMCHNVAGAGGALTQGKYAPALGGVESVHVYEAMVTGPQNMPVFNDANISPEDKANIISYLTFLNENPSPGGFDLGSLGPVSEGLFIWIFGLGGIVAITIWLTAKSN